MRRGEERVTVREMRERKVIGGAMVWESGRAEESEIEKSRRVGQGRRSAGAQAIRRSGEQELELSGLASRKLPKAAANTPPAALTSETRQTYGGWRRHTYRPGGTDYSRA